MVAPRNGLPSGAASRLRDGLIYHSHLLNHVLDLNIVLVMMMHTVRRLSLPYVDQFVKRVRFLALLVFHVTSPLLLPGVDLVCLIILATNSSAAMRVLLPVLELLLYFL
jgi:hypothetical protein